MMMLTKIWNRMAPKRLREQRHLDLIITIVIWGTIALATYFEYVTLLRLPPTLAAAIFTVIIGTIGALFSVLIVYNEIILGAQTLGDTSRVTQSYIWPVKIAVFGFLIAIISSFVSIPIGDWKPPIFSLQELESLLMLFLLLYAIFTFHDAFTFTVDVVTGMEEEKLRQIIDQKTGSQTSNEYTDDNGQISSKGQDDL